MARDDGDGGRRNSSSSSSSRQELTATASIPQFAPANSSGPLSGDDSSSIKQKKKNKGPLGKLLVVLGDWITWFFKGWAKYSPLLAAVAAPMSTLLDIPALAVSGNRFTFADSSSNRGMCETTSRFRTARHVSR